MYDVSTALHYRSYPIATVFPSGNSLMRDCFKKYILMLFLHFYIITLMSTYEMNKVLMSELLYINVILFIYFLWFNLS